MHNLLKVLFLLYVSGASGYLISVVMAVIEDRGASWRVAVMAVICTPIWPIIVAIIMNNRRSR